MRKRNLNMALMPRPHSYDHPRVNGYEPIVCCSIERVSRSKRNAWRQTIVVDDNPMATGHHDTRYAAESKGAAMLKVYAEIHYFQT
jgi:hypothetical protein